ncbi:MFS transporter [Corticibacter populi]|uniref:MFS transporter n=1 Tax=Corticibacter populi TaxID=1550736 RepID=A0A3M6QMS5_9BURK|nr:MFS transporter [Corticibacter populi]
MLAVLGLALNLRPALAVIGPLLDMIEAATGLSHTQASLLTTLPVFVMGLCALGGMRITHWLGERNGVSLGIALIAMACAARYDADGGLQLLTTAILAGIGIALVQTLLPAFIQRRFVANAAKVFGLYTTGIMAGSAIAATSAAGLAQWWGWPAALAIWALPAVLALALWRLATPPLVQHGAAAASAPAIPQAAFWRNLRAWELMVFFGIGTGAYTLVLAWLPPFYTSLGWTPAAAGLMLGGLTVIEVVAGLVVSATIGRFIDRRGPLLLVLAMLMAGLMCLIIAPLSLALPACLLLGAGIGALFPLSLIVALDHVKEPARVGRLAAFVQGGGYIIASGMPLLAGLLRDRFADLSHAWVAMLVGTLFLLALCWRFSPASYVRIDA